MAVRRVGSLTNFYHGLLGWLGDMADSIPILEAIGVEKRYSEAVYALHSVDLEVHEGETVVVIGESGSGKTTLLRLFNRMVEPTAGQVRVAGETCRLRSSGGLHAVPTRRLDFRSQCAFSTSFLIPTTNPSESDT